MSTSFSGNEGQVIYVDDSSEVAFWAKQFDVPRSRIKEAVKAVGPMVQDVQAWLARNYGSRP